MKGNRVEQERREAIRNNRLEMKRELRAFLPDLLEMTKHPAMMDHTRIDLQIIIKRLNKLADSV